MQALSETLRAPEFRVTRWINSPPLTLAGLRGRVVLVDFWDYTCVNCLHTLPYLREWHRRYGEAGLVIVGLHAPEFAFSKDAALIEAAVRRLEIDYPVALDNDYQTWTAYANRYWPAKYFIDARGTVRGFHFGEGAYAECEGLIQQMLRETTPDAVFPAPMPAVRELDIPGTLCRRPTPELYLGYERGRLGNPEGVQPGHSLVYAVPKEPLPQDTVFLSGCWLSAGEYTEFAGPGTGTISVVYQAAEVNLVVYPAAYPAQGSGAFRLYQDGVPLPPSHWGEDVVSDAQGLPAVVVDSPRMVRLVKNPGFETRRLVLETDTPGLRAYAFTFVSCPDPDTALA